MAHMIRAHEGTWSEFQAIRTRLSAALGTTVTVDWTLSMAIRALGKEMDQGEIVITVARSVPEITPAEWPESDWAAVETTEEPDDFMDGFEEGEAPF